MGLSNLRSEASKKTDCKFEKNSSFMPVSETVASLNVKKAIGKDKIVGRRQKKLKAYDLSTLSEFLPELKDPRPHPPPPSKFELSCKSRQKLVLKEGKQLMAVLNHPVFQSDPLGAIHQHLQCTQLAIDKKPLKSRIRGGKKKKQKKSKSSAPRPMDV